MNVIYRGGIFRVSQNFKHPLGCGDCLRNIWEKPWAKESGGEVNGKSNKTGYSPNCFMEKTGSFPRIHQQEMEGKPTNPIGFAQAWGI